jgi:hypothetical protein
MPLLFSSFFPEFIVAGVEEFSVRVVLVQLIYAVEWCMSGQGCLAEGAVCAWPVPSADHFPKQGAIKKFISIFKQHHSHHCSRAIAATSFPDFASPSRASPNVILHNVCAD